MERRPWNRRHFLYGMFAGTCVGTVLATVLFTLTTEQMYIILIPVGFLSGMGIGAARCLMEEPGAHEK
jgi:hypothetical protein